MSRNEMSKFDNDGFQIVTSKRSSRNKPRKLPSGGTFIKEESLIDPDKALCRINAAVEDLQNSQYVKDAFGSLNTLLQSKVVKEIVCLGLGHIADSHISRHQLAFLLCLQDQYNPHKVLVHDPIFSSSECEVFKRLNIEIINENQEGHYIISEKDITVLYFPHCPRELTNNFLWSNWGINLQNCIFITNSFTSLIENQPSRCVKKSIPYVQKIYPHTTEVILQNSFKFFDVFNDISVHYFPKENLEKLNSSFWIKGERPQYDTDEEHITNLMCKSLNI